MLNKMTRVASAVMVMSICLSLFAGCSGKAGDNAGKKTAEASQQVKPKLKVLFNYMNDDYNTYPVAKILQDKTGYEVQYDKLPVEKPQDKLNLIMASGEKYDLIKTNGITLENKSKFFEFAKKKAIIEMGSLIDKYGKNIKNSISQQSFDDFKVDDKTYFIPTKKTTVNKEGSVGSSLMIRTDWLEKVGMQKPKTPEELTAVLKAFKEKDPGGNGSNNIPLTMSGDATGINGVLGAFGVPNSWNDVNGKLVPQVLDQGFKDYIGFMNNLYTSGILDKDFPVNTTTTAREKFASGKSGALQISWNDVPTILDALKKNVPDARVEYLEPLVGKSGVQVFNAATGYDTLAFIPAVSENAEHVIKWIDAKLEPETYKLSVLGEEGKHYTVKDGNYYPISPIFFNEFNNANNYLVGIDETNYPKYWLARLRKDDRLYSSYEFLNIKNPKWAKVDVLSNPPLIPSYVKYASELSELTSTYLVKAIAGAEPLSSYDNFVQTWKSKGGEELNKDINDWYSKRNK